MSIRNLEAFFRPRSVAVIGATTRPHAVGGVVIKNLLAGGFDGSIMPVNPKYAAVAGVLAYPDVQHLPVVPDLAVICTPPPTVPQIIAELGGRGTKGAIVITAGFKELGNAQGAALEAAMLAAARPHIMRIVGPNCVGIMSTGVGLNASFAHMAPRKGHVAFVTQSGAMATTILDWAGDRGIGFSHVVSLGDMADVDFGDMLDYLANDIETTAILLYIEAITSARKFMSAARAAARLKPVIAIKAGRHAAAARAAASHTGAMAGVDAVYDAAFRRAGMLRVQALEELFDAAETLAYPLAIDGDRLAILTNGGGAGVLATDALMDLDGRLADLSPDILQRLDEVLPPTWSHGNPVDIIGDAPSRRYGQALDTLLASDEADAVLVLNCPTAIASSGEAAQEVIRVVTARRRCVLTCWLGGAGVVDARQAFNRAGIPTYETPDEAVRGFMHSVRYRRNQEQLMEVPPATDGAPNADEARAIVRSAIAEHRSWLSETEVARLLASYGIPTVRSALVATPAAAAAKAAEYGCPVALKIFSPDIIHKSDVGGVRLDLAGSEAVRAAAVAMQRDVKEAAPNARLAGLVVQEMIHRPAAHELILGMAVDAQFGPFLLFGQGGTGAEVIADRALALPPLNVPLAMEMMSRTRILRQLKGYRNRPAANLDAIASVLVALSQLVCDIDEVVEMDLNPLLADAAGVIVLDARIKVAGLPVGAFRGSRLAIPAYPKELEQAVIVAGAGEVLLRPIRPEDGAAVVRLFESLSPEDVRLRFFSPVRHLSKGLLARFTQIDYDREMAFVLEMPGPNRDLIGIGRLAADPDNQRAEFAITVRSDLKGNGIGTLLMRRLLAYGKAHGIGEVFGDILAENHLMLGLARDLGFAVRPLAGSPGVVRATLNVATLRGA